MTEAIEVCGKAVLDMTTRAGVTITTGRAAR
jgi:hypothetical protein